MGSSKSVGKKQAKSFDGPKWSSLAQAKNYGKDRLYDRKLRTGWTHWPASITLLITRKRRTWGTSRQPTVSWSKLLMHFREKREWKPKSKLNCNVLITNQPLFFFQKSEWTSFKTKILSCYALLRLTAGYLFHVMIVMQFFYILDKWESPDEFHNPVLFRFFDFVASLLRVSWTSTLWCDASGGFFQNIYFHQEP